LEEDVASSKYSKK
jgi:hypothetical protein